VAENYGYCICVAGGWRQITDTVLVLQAVGGILLILYLCCRRLAAKRSRTRGAWWRAPGTRQTPTSTSPAIRLTGTEFSKVQRHFPWEERGDQMWTSDYSRRKSEYLFFSISFVLVIVCFYVFTSDKSPTSSITHKMTSMFFSVIPVPAYSHSNKKVKYLMLEYDSPDECYFDYGIKDHHK
jgi:hypothetical protein